MNSRAFVVALLLVGPAFGAMDGTVVNKTTGRPQAGVSITLVKPGQGGMKTLGTTTSDAGGKFAFEKDEPGGGPQLLQATYKGVNYNKLMTPNVPTQNVELEIYEATATPDVAHIAQRMMIFEPNTSQLAVNETIIFQNSSNTTYTNEKTGSLRFYLPPAANGQVRINAQGPQGMPLPRPAEKTEQSDVFKVNYPIKPGETQFEISYVLPAGTPFTFRGRVTDIKGMPATPLRLVAPSGVTLGGKDIQTVGTEPKTQATIYTVMSSANYAVEVSGTGSLRAGNDQGTADNGDQPQLTEGSPKIYQHMSWLLGLAFAILGVGLAVLFRNSPVRAPYGK